MFYVSGLQTLSTEGPEGLMRLIIGEVRWHQAAVVVLDGLFVVRDLVSDEHAFRGFVHELQGQAGITGATLLILTHEALPGVAPERTMVDGWIDLRDELYGPRAVRSLVVHKQRGSRYLRGRHQFRITDDGIRVFPRVEALLSREPAPSGTTGRMTTGIGGLDRMIGGGYPQGSDTLLIGPSGVGKTTIGLQFLAACTPESTGLLFGFYETLARLRARSGH